MKILQNGSSFGYSIEQFTRQLFKCLHFLKGGSGHDSKTWSFQLYTLRVAFRVLRHPEAAEIRKWVTGSFTEPIYPILPDPTAEGAGLIRVIDDSGEDYLYPAENFIPVPLSAAIEQVLSAIPVGMNAR